MLKRRGAMTHPCGLLFLSCGNPLPLLLPIERVKLQLPPSSMITYTMRLSGRNCSNLQVEAALTAATDVIKEPVWFIIIHCLFTAGSVEFLALQLFVIFVEEELA